MPFKQVWILNHYAQEPGGAGGTRHFSLAQHLQTLGWKTTLLAASVDHNTGRQRLANNENTRLETFDGVPFLWVKTPPYKGNGGGRMLNMLAYAYRVCLPSTTCELAKPDVVVGSSVHPFAAVSGAWLAKRHCVPFVFEVRDLWPQTLIDLGRLHDDGLVTRLLRWLELWLYRRAEKIVVLLPKASDYIAPLGIHADKVVWIPNGVELDGYDKPSPPAIRNEFTLMYFGAHGQANNLDCVLGAMAELSKRPNMRHVRLRLIGDGPLKPALMAQARQLNLSTVIFEDSVPKTKIPQLASEADAFVICVKDLPQLYKYGISMNKLFDYLAASRPVIMASAAVNDPVKDAGAGFTVKPGSSFELAEAIDKLVKLSPDQKIAMGEAARAYVERHHSFSVLALKFAKVFEELD
jgi:glycosyltransferase involved in cell wall biosynthesis